MAALGWLWVAIVWVLLVLGAAVGLVSLLAPRRVVCPRCSGSGKITRYLLLDGRGGPCRCTLCAGTGWVGAKP